MRKHIHYVFSEKMLGLFMVFIFIIGLIITLQNVSTTQTVHSHADQIALSKIPHIKAHHPIHDRNLFIHALTAQSVSNGYKPTDIQGAYNLPTSGGNGVIAIVDAFDTPTAENDLNVFDTKFGLPSCTKANGCFSVVYQSGTKPGQDPAKTWQLETDLDIEWAHAIAPNAKIVLVETDSDLLSDLITGVTVAENQTGVVSISMSWGANGEFSQETQVDSLLVSQTGATFFAASGDTGYGATWPAVSPNVISVGGTTLVITNGNVKETAWSGSGGGLSLFEPIPSFQSSLPLPNSQGHRGTPDISINADPNTGNLVYDGTDGFWHVIGGTSLATPIWAAINTLGSSPLTPATLYQNAKTNYPFYYRDIIFGTNGTCGTYCKASAGYDYVTGLGSPIALPLSTSHTTPTTTPTKNPSPTQSPTPTTTPSPTPIEKPTLTPTPTTDPNGTSISISIGLHGVGRSGDNVNPNGIGTLDPRHPTRAISITLSDVQNKQFGPFNGFVNFNSHVGLFSNTLSLGSLPTGDYQLKISSPEYLTKIVPTFIHLTQKQTTPVPPVFLIAGDIDSSNALTVLDYAALADCYGTKQNGPTCKYPPTATSFGADLDDNGIIDGVDYNLFVRELSVQVGN